MSLRAALFMAVTLAVPAGGALAQSVGPVSPATAAQPAPEPALLRLPIGARVRLQTTAQASWIKGILASADSDSVALVPEGAPSFAQGRLSIPGTAVTRFELSTGTKRRWRTGLVAGAVLGVALGFATYDPACAYGPCGRGVSAAGLGLMLGGVGAGIGALLKTDRWTPVALEAFAPPPARVSRAELHLRALRRGGVSLGLAVGF